MSKVRGAWIIDENHIANKKEIQKNITIDSPNKVELPLVVKAHDISYYNKLI